MRKVFALLACALPGVQCDDNPNCILIVPANPLTAAGLATPYKLTSTDPTNAPCHQSNPNQSAFVQGAIINTDTGEIFSYDPLVIDLGTQAAIAPPVPKLPTNFVIGLWFGFQGSVLTLKLSDATGNCIK
jgi:hypothetical protein